MKGDGEREGEVHYDVFVCGLIWLGWDDGIPLGGALGV